MPFIGKQPEVGAYQLIDSITTSATATYALTVDGSAYFPASARNLIVSLNGVTQAPESAYTVSGSNIVFDSALTASDVIDYILVIGDAVDIGTPSDGTVGNAQLASNIDLSGKTLTLSDNQISGDAIDGGTISNFASTGIDDNATSTAITIDGSGNVGIGTATFDANVSLQVKRSGNNSYLAVEGDVSKVFLGCGSSQNALYSNDENGNAKNFHLITGSSTPLVVSANGNVGIGENNPQNPLHITVAGSDFATLRLDAPSNTTPATYGFRAHDGILDIRNFQNSTTPFVLDSSGNVGIGGSPREKLHVITASNGLGTVADASANELVLENTGATGMTFLSPNTAAQTIAFGDTNNRKAGWIEYDHATNAMAFGTVNASSERMRLDGNGNLLVGTTVVSPGYGNTTVGAALRALGIVHGSTASGPAGTFNRNGTGSLLAFYNSSVSAGSVSINSANTVQYLTSSDVRLKENITDAPAGNIDAIRVRSFDWKADGTHQTYGMVAQELAEVAPEAVSQGETDEDVWGVDYSKLVPMMIKEIQDLKAEVAALKGA